MIPGGHFLFRSLLSKPRASGDDPPVKGLSSTGSKPRASGDDPYETMHAAVDWL